MQAVAATLRSSCGHRAAPVDRRTRTTIQGSRRVLGVFTVNIWPPHGGQLNVQRTGLLKTDLCTSRRLAKTTLWNSTKVRTSTAKLQRAVCCQEQVCSDHAGGRQRSLCRIRIFRPVECFFRMCGRWTNKDTFPPIPEYECRQTEIPPCEAPRLRSTSLIVQLSTAPVLS